VLVRAGKEHRQRLNCPGLVRISFYSILNFTFDPITPDFTFDPITPDFTFDPITPGFTFDPITPDFTFDPVTPDFTFDPIPLDFNFKPSLDVTLDFSLDFPIELTSLDFTYDPSFDFTFDLPSDPSHDSGSLIGFSTDPTIRPGFSNGFATSLGLHNTPRRKRAFSLCTTRFASLRIIFASSGRRKHLAWFWNRATGCGRKHGDLRFRHLLVLFGISPAIRRFEPHSCRDRGGSNRCRRHRASMAVHRGI
jgi:hypothetical protein